MLKESVKTLRELYQQKFNTEAEEISKLPQSGSNRSYFKLTGKVVCIGVVAHDLKENEAFFSFSDSFQKTKLPVPELYIVSKNKQAYLQSYLGEKTLYQVLQSNDDEEYKIHLYKKSIEILLKFQFEGVKSVDFSKAYPRAEFDEQSVRWDLNYFKYNFLKLLDLPFDEQLLEDDFNEVIKCVSSIASDCFLYRDFQSSNIMVREDDVFFIDYQGGRKGSYYYDIASLLYDAKANLSDSVRIQLRDFYKEKLQAYTSVSSGEFNHHFALFVLIRILQAMGAYGYRGLHQKKSQFIKSIPLAVGNINKLLSTYDLPVRIPELLRVFQLLTDHPLCKNADTERQNHKLHIRLNSFSFKKGIPHDETGNGGGYIFDCRGLPNPGRYSEYTAFTGKDEKVIQFFKKEQKVADYIRKIYEVIDVTILDYLERNRSNLMINFGCTGGQHRSVYCAENVREYLKKYDVEVSIRHIEQGDI